MDFQRFVESFLSPTCIASVEKTGDGGYGEIRLVAGNKKYTDMIDMRMGPDTPERQGIGGSSFVPGLLYTEYFPQNLSFEDVCFRAAIIMLMCGLISMQCR